ncbi:uncharacterized protein LOC119444826 [Dermacentor silvarum]|uniref:uncharacterized protein LOC119444826 n=1 Tax=Dermacentor silvarum TaxID=543639 RepID=UPI002100CDED|nr:uncharacterized protein LOC119444826 [Dermacentor silvarum]
MVATAAVHAGLVIFTAAVLRLGAAENEEKFTCVQMRVGTASRECVNNLFHNLRVPLEMDTAIPLPKGSTERVKILATGCLALRALHKIPEFGCVPASSIVETYECVYSNEENKEEVLRSFAANSKDKYLEIADKVESCFGSWHGTRNKAHPRIFNSHRD